MHVPDHAGELPKHVDPIPMPDTWEEAAILGWLLDIGLYPTCEALRFLSCPSFLLFIDLHCIISGRLINKVVRTHGRLESPAYPKRKPHR